jgi:hypothetical protein
MIQIAALRSRLEKQPTDLRRNPRDLGDGGLNRVPGRANKSIAFCYHLVRMFEKVAPDTSWFNQVRKRPSKGGIIFGDRKIHF